MIQVELERAEGRTSGVIPGTGRWASILQPRVGRYAVVMCPQCLTTMNIQPPTHKISATGKVAPGVSCANKACDWQAELMLKGWTP